MNATAAIGKDGTSVELSAAAPEGFQPVASSYGRASWPMTLFFAEVGGNPLIPWYSNFTNVHPWAPPAAAAEVRVPAVAEHARAWTAVVRGIGE